MAESIFLKLEGNTAKNKIWDFLVTYQDYDYSLKEISELSKVGYTRLKELFKKEFVRKNIVIFTRKIGNAKLYKLNKKNPIVKKFIEYYWTVVDTHLDSKEKKESDYSGRVSLGAVSARNI